MLNENIVISVNEVDADKEKFSLTCRRGLGEPCLEMPRKGG